MSTPSDEHRVGKIKEGGEGIIIGKRPYAVDFESPGPIAYVKFSIKLNIYLIFCV